MVFYAFKCKAFKLIEKHEDQSAVVECSTGDQGVAGLRLTRETQSGKSGTI